MKKCLICGQEIQSRRECDVCAICGHASDHERILILAERVHKLDRPVWDEAEREKMAEEIDRLKRWLTFIHGFELDEYGGHIGAAQAALEGKPAPRW